MGEKIVELAGKMGVDPEKVSLARIYIPPYVRVKDGQQENVDGYWRNVTFDKLTPDEKQAVLGQDAKFKQAADIGRAKNARPAKLSIRKASYRGKDGFTVSGQDTQGRSVKVFADDRPKAEQVKVNISGGKDAFDGMLDPQTEQRRLASKAAEASNKIISDDGSPLSKVAAANRALEAERKAIKAELRKKMARLG